MNLYRKKYLYANGSSVTAGGGFEPKPHRLDVRTLYEAKWITLPETMTECSYPFFIAQKLNLQLINDAKCGSGIDRLIRTSMEWIVNNEDKLEETIFIFEPQFGIRLDWYVKEWEQYGVLNAHRNEKGEYPSTLVNTWYMDNWEEQNKWNEKYKSAIDGYLLNFFDENVQYELELKRLLAFVHTLNDKKIDYLISLPTHMDDKFLQQFKKIIPKKSDLFFKIKENIDVPLLKKHMEHIHFGDNLNIWQYAAYKKLLISDEIENNDNHIGYMGNQIVANMISEYIIHYNTISYYSEKTNRDLLKEGFIKNLPIKFNRVNNLETADFIYLADMFMFEFDELFRVPPIPTDFTDFIKKIDDAFPWLRSLNKQNKRFLIVLVHERINTSTLMKFFSLVENEYGIKRSQLWYIDVSVMDYPCSNNIPLEVKLKSFVNFSKADLIDNPSIRSKKIISLNNKINDSRLLVFDRLLFEYKDYDSLKNENIISMRSNDYKSILVRVENKIKNQIKMYDNIQFPWEADTLPSTPPEYAHISLMYQNLINLNNQCVFSIVNETEKITFGDSSSTQHYNFIAELQFSEKCILPILSETHMFVITDGIFYRNMERIGFDFSYLKKIFDIDYLTNTLYENIDEVTKIVRFTKNKSIHELNDFRKENYHYLRNNKKLFLDIALGDSTEKEVQFWEQLSGKSL